MIFLQAADAANLCLRIFIISDDRAAQWISSTVVMIYFLYTMDSYSTYSSANNALAMRETCPQRPFLQDSPRGQTTRQRPYIFQDAWTFYKL